jgi:hypothetical protein
MTGFSLSLTLSVVSLSGMAGSSRIDDRLDRRMNRPTAG